MNRTTIDVDNYTLTHMLGYLDAKKWRDALKNNPELDKELIKRLIDIQDKQYGGIKSEVFLDEEE